MIDPTRETGISPSTSRSKRRHKSAIHKIVAVDATHLGLSSPRHHKPTHWGKGLAVALTAISGFMVIAVCSALGLLVAGIVGLYVYFATGLPPASQLAAVHIDQSTKIYDRNGQLLFEVFDQNSGRRTVIPPEQIPEVMKQATIATEDPNFYTNPGVDMEGIARAAYYLFTTKQIVTGGSTITQQLVKNMLLSPEQTYDRKIREAILSLEVGRRYSKEEIMALYLNMNYYGNLSYGIQAAAQDFFRKDAKDLNLAESSLLAGLPQQPSVYDPCSNPDTALDRQKVVLGLMVKNRFITDQQASDAADQMSNYIHDASFKDHCTVKVSPVAPHFVDYVTHLLEEKYGPEEVYKGGLQVYTSLDPDIQKIVEDEARKQISQLKAQNVGNAAVVVENPQTGEILAMLGSVNYFDKSIDGQVNVADRLRQPGSSIKPINYVTAFEKGWSPATPILDTKSVYDMGTGYPPYIPVNYDHKYHGVVNVRMALANSLNIPAVRTLYYVTVPDMITSAQRFGYTSFTDPSRYGLSMTLGGAEVKLVEHTGAYATFANLGVRVPISPFRKIVDGQGHVLVDIENNPPSGERVIDARYAYQISSILSDNNARIMEFGPHSPLELDRPAAAKTGTTNDFRDNWTMGYTPELVVGVWVGNSNNKAMINSTGITGAAPIWHNVMERIYKEIDPYKGIKPHAMKVPSGLVQVTVCKESGLLPTPACPASHRYTEIFLAEQAPTTFDKFWDGGWGSTCIPFMGAIGNENPAATKNNVTAKNVVSVAGMPFYDILARQAVARGMPQGMAGLGNCAPPPAPAPQADNGGDNNQPPPPPPPPPGKKKK